MAMDLVYKSNIYNEYTIKSLLEEFSNVIHLVLENEDMMISELTFPLEDDYDGFEAEFGKYYQDE
jgi:hypothetical protein